LQLEKETRIKDEWENVVECLKSGSGKERFSALNLGDKHLHIEPLYARKIKRWPIVYVFWLNLMDAPQKIKTSDGWI